MGEVHLPRPAAFSLFSFETAQKKEQDLEDRACWYSETLTHALNAYPETEQEQEQDLDAGMPAIRADEDIVMHSNAGLAPL